MRVQSSKSAASGACRPKRAPSGNAAFQVELTAQLADQAGISRTRRELLDQAIEIALSGSSTIPHGTSRVQRRIHRLRPNERTPSEGVILRLRSGWEEDIASVEKEIAAAPATDATLHLLIDRVRHEDLAREIAIQKAAESVLQLKGVPGTDPGREARDAMQSRADKAKAAAATLLHEAVDRARVVQAGGAVASGEPADAVREAAGKALARFYPKFLDADHAGWGKVLDSARRKDPDAIKAVDHSGTPETHPVCKAVLAVLGPGRKGSDIRSKFMATPYGWPQDAIDAALTVLGNAGQVRVTGEDGKATSLPDLPRAKLGTCTFRAETTVITVGQRLAVAGLLQESETPFEKNQEAFALSALLGRLEVAAASAGGEPPAPAATSVPNITTLRSLSGNELLAALAASASDLKQLMKGWKQTAQAISTRMPKWRLAERLVAVGADDQRGALNAVRDGRSLLGRPRSRAAHHCRRDGKPAQSPEFGFRGVGSRLAGRRTPPPRQSKLGAPLAGTETRHPPGRRAVAGIKARSGHAASRRRSVAAAQPVRMGQHGPGRAGADRRCHCAGCCPAGAQGAAGHIARRLAERRN